MVTKSSALVFILLLGTLDGPATRSADQAALKPFAGLVGEWKGTGLPQRGSAKGSWTEKSDWAWKLSNESAALAFTSPTGKYVRSAILRPGSKAKAFVLEATLSDGSKRLFHGELAARNVLAMTAEKSDPTGLAKITLTPLHDTRFLMLLEGRDESGTVARLGEVGFTRQGVAFAAGDSSPVCIVTEGRGTTPVTYKGKTYYVCCSGCKDLFNEDPEAVLAEAAKRAKAKAK